MYKYKHRFSSCSTVIAFKTFKRVIQETHKDGMIVKLLEQESGTAFTNAVIIRPAVIFDVR